MVITKICNKNNDGRKLEINNFKKRIQSSNVNFLFGAGFSHGVADLLGNIENLLAKAYEENDINKIKALKEDFFKKSILPNIDDKKIQTNKKNRDAFLDLIKKIVDNRESSILHKIVNVFTTNYDLLIECSLESNKIEYVDGFLGRINPVFSTANYGCILNKQANISNMTTEITTFNVYKVHGSLNWSLEGNDIYRVDIKERINKINDKIGTGDFLSEYDKLAIVNPSKNKLKQTVLEVNYYDQLRLYCNELEKKNTILVAFGFSFEDEHILQMTKRCLSSNPSLTLMIFAFNDDAVKAYEEKFKSFDSVIIYQLVDEYDAMMDFTQVEVNKIFEEVYNATK